jgi:hypothetical protein
MGSIIEQVTIRTGSEIKSKKIYVSVIWNSRTGDTDLYGSETRQIPIALPASARTRAWHSNPARRQNNCIYEGFTHRIPARGNNSILTAAQIAKAPHREMRGFITA